MLIRGGLNKAGRTKVGALAVIDVHARDTMQKMHENGVDTVEHFDWISRCATTGDLRAMTAATFVSSWCVQTGRMAMSTSVTQ